MSENLYDSLRDVAISNAAAPCMMVGANEQIRYDALYAQVNRIARVLHDSGVTEGDRIAVMCEKTPMVVSLYLACIQIGAIYVPLNTAYTASELRYFLGDADPKILVVGDFLSRKVAGSAFQFTLKADGSGTLDDAQQAVRNPFCKSAKLDSDSVAAILYTSGTTGLSKGAMLTHGNLLSNADTLVSYWGFTNRDVLLHALPIYHVHGLFVAINCVLLSGCSMIFQEKFDIDGVVRALPNSSVMMGVPTYYTRLLANPDFNRSSVSNMRLFISGSAPLTEQTFREFEERTHMKILERYGMSETLMITSNPLVGERRAGTVGFALPGVQVRITDSEGVELPVGEVGNIELTGPNVFKGYWKKPEKTASEFRSDGYFKTGDMGVQDDEGRVSIVGREKDLVISGGLNVYPAEVETEIGDLSDVADVAVIGAPHDDFGEGVVAVLVTRSNMPISTKDLRDRLRSSLANYKLPQKAICVSELPRNAMGKVLKNELREQYKEVFGSFQAVA